MSWLGAVFAGTAVRDARASEKNGRKSVLLTLKDTREYNGNTYTDYVSVWCSGKLADLAGGIKEGTTVVASGYPRASVYKDKDGEARADQALTADSLFLPSGGTPARKPAGRAATPAAEEAEETDEVTEAPASGDEDPFA